MRYTLLLPIFILAFSACSMQQNNRQSVEKAAIKTANAEDLAGASKAYFASGCFWCVEAVFESVKGVSEAVSGYSGGEIKNPTYQQVSSGRIKHAEAVEVYYDPEVIDYATLVKVFFGSHDPTTANRQGPDRGPQYRSMVYYQNESEKQIVEAYIKQLEEAKTYDAPIVTEVVPFEIFYDAEDYHQDYERNNPNNPYIRQVSIPRLKRFQKKFPELLKEDTH
ncbi:MAG: peptide-methionine (S)-S-oxide reductase MsrA [Bacteroidia bacterium]